MPISHNPYTSPPPPPQSGFSDSVLSGTAYLGLAFCAIPTLVILIWQWHNTAVRFHVLQALAYGLVGVVFSVIFGPLAGLQTLVLGDLLGGLLSLMTLTVLFLSYILLWVVMTYRVYSGHELVIPVIGPFIQQKI